MPYRSNSLKERKPHTESSSVLSDGVATPTSAHPETLAYTSPTPKSNYSTTHVNSSGRLGKELVYVSPSQKPLSSARESVLDSSKFPVRVGVKVVEKLRQSGQDDLAENLLDRLESVGYDEIQLPQLSTYVHAATESYGKARSLVDQSQPSGSDSATSSKSSWTKNTLDSQKKLCLTDPSHVWESVKIINSCEHRCGKSFVVSQKRQEELSFNTLMVRREQYGLKTNQEKKLEIVKVLESCAEPPFHILDDDLAATLCFKCLAEYYNRPISTLNQWRRDARSGVVAAGAVLQGSREHQSEDSAKTWAANLFIEWFIKHFGVQQKNIIVGMPETSMYSGCPADLFLIDKYTTAQLKQEFDLWIGSVDIEVTVSETHLKKLWDVRLASSDPFPVQIRLDTGRRAGCDTCSRLFLRYLEAPRAEKQKRMEERMAHRQFVANQRSWHDSGVLEHIDNPNVDLWVQDGYDTWKSGIPAYAQAKPSAGAILPVKLKVSGTITFGKQCVLTVTPPWVGTGGNLSVTAFMSSLIIRVNALPPGVGLPKTLKLAVDGGTENWSKNWYTFGAWMVGVGIYEEVFIQRFPAHHGYNGMDATFAPMSTYFFGSTSSREKGKNVQTIPEFIVGMRKAYEARKPGGILGGQPVISQLGCSFDFASYIEPYVDPELHGWGHSTMEWLDQNNALVRGKRGSSIHYLHFFMDSAGHVRMRYKNAPTYPEEAWQPKGPEGETPDGKSCIGVTLFKCKAAELPRHAPAFAAFKPWDEDDEIKTSILKAPEKAGSEFMSEESRTVWKEFFDGIPASSATVPAERQPRWWQFQQQATSHVNVAGTQDAARVSALLHITK